MATTLFDLVAKLTLDAAGFAKGVTGAVGKGADLAKKMGGFVADTAAAALEITKTAALAAGTVYATVTTAAVKHYAEYEQLVGGVETLFKGSAGKVQEYADMAYKTAGLSANDYMSTVTGFSASLMQSLGGDTERAADLANQAVIDMSDNANKMGTSMGSIMYAYQGFAKQNYTMLDNLKLGYGGTREEMERLLEDASLLAGREFQMDNFADIIEAIHVIQDNMGITGTTAQEASETINGSIASWKSALDNLLTGIGRNENIDQLVDNLVESTEDVIANLVPAIRRASEGFMQVMRIAVVRIGPQVLNAFRDIWNNKLPGVMTSAANGIIGLVNDIFGTNIPTIGTINLPTWEELQTIVTEWWAGIRTNISTIADWTIGIFTAPTETATDMTTTFTTWWEETAKPAILSISTWTLNLFGMPEAEENTITAHVSAWWNGVVPLVQNACVWTLQIFGFSETAATDAVNTISAWFGGVVTLLGDTLTLIFDWASGTDAETLAGEVETIYEGAKGLIGQALEFAWDLVPGPIQEKLQPLVDSLSTFWADNEKTILGLIESLTGVYNMISGLVMGMVTDTLSDDELWASLGATLSSFMDAVTAVADALAPVAETTFSTLLSGIKGTLDTIEPLLSTIKPILADLSPVIQNLVNALVAFSNALWGERFRTITGFVAETVSGAVTGESMVVPAGDGTYKVIELNPEVTNAQEAVAEETKEAVWESGGDLTPNTDKNFFQLFWEAISGKDMQNDKPANVVAELESVKGEIEGLRADLIAAVNSIANRPIAINGKTITDIVGQGILRKARTTYG